MSDVIDHPQVARYTRTAMALHWIVAALLVVNVTLGLIVDLIPESSVRTSIDLHKSIGITVLGLVLLRILWRLAHRPPAMPATYAPWERLSAHAAHIGLYLLILAIPVSGWMHDSAFKDAPQHPLRLFWLVPFPRISWIEHTEPVEKEQLHSLFYSFHAYAAYALYALVALHVVGALKHQFWDRESELQRMMPGR